MGAASDPFSHHPELCASITDPDASFFRDFSNATLAAKMREMGLPGGWWRSDEEREALRAETLAEIPDGDLWVFAYGSLMWDPGFRFAEVRRARAPSYARRFILKDVHGGRGDHAAPGLMAALDTGKACDGLLFRIARDAIDAETEILWRREQAAPAYLARLIEVETALGRAQALAFVADHGADLIDADLTRAEQIHCLATGRGFLGASLDYLRNIVAKFALLGVEDAEATALLAETEAYAQSL